MHNNLLINPAFSGNQQYWTSNLVYRTQWVNLEGAPNTVLFSSHTGVKDRRLGMGLWLAHDQVGVHENTQIYGTYAYHIKLRHGYIAMGLQAGMQLLRSDFTRLNLQNPNDPDFLQNIRTWQPNFGSGVVWKQKNTMLSLSVPAFLKAPTADLSRQQDSQRAPRQLLAYVSHREALNRQTQLQLSALLHALEGSPMAVDLAANLIYKNTVSGGIAFRQGLSVGIMFSCHLGDGLFLGYAYDYALTSLSAFSQGSHELQLTYRLNLPALHRPPPRNPTYF